MKEVKAGRNCLATEMKEIKTEMSNMKFELKKDTRKLDLKFSTLTDNMMGPENRVSMLEREVY